jgi:hypothetical protein
MGPSREESVGIWSGPGLESGHLSEFHQLMTAECQQGPFPGSDGPQGAGLGRWWWRCVWATQDCVAPPTCLRLLMLKQGAAAWRTAFQYASSAELKMLGTLGL